MKNQEVLLASAVIAAVAGVGASLAARAFVDAPGRSEAEPRLVALESVAAEPVPDTSATDRALDELRLENAALRERLAMLEERLAGSESQRTPLAAESAALAAGAASPAAVAELAAAQGIVVTPEFVASVGQALDTIRAREEAEREARRKELQAQRIEERLTRLQQELGLSNRQVSDMRTVLGEQENKREALFASMRDTQGDPRSTREGFRTIRDETVASLQAILTPEQLEGYKRSEESEFGRRDFGRGPDDFRGRGEGDFGRPAR